MAVSKIMTNALDLHKEAVVVDASVMESVLELSEITHDLKYFNEMKQGGIDVAFLMGAIYGGREKFLEGIKEIDRYTSIVESNKDKMTLVTSWNNLQTCLRKQGSDHFGYSRHKDHRGRTFLPANLL